MNYQTTAEFARQLDTADKLATYRDKFLIPQHNGHDAIYLCGNSLGLQPRSAKEYIDEQLTAWQSKAVESWFDGDKPWLSYHKEVAALAAPVVGAHTDEVTAMNSLTVNLHLLLVSFYKPNNKRFKILMEAGAFPSDQYAVESQVRFYDLDPSDAIIELKPRSGEYTLRTDDILKAIDQNKNELALVLFGGINYYTGQVFDMQAIAKAAHNAGAYAGFDLAHAAGNVPIKLHDWDIDFACWCSYKYMNSGPGGISGIFVHKKHHHDQSLKRFAGWWGYREDKRFLMQPGFEAAIGAEGWQVSTSPILLLALHKASLDIFEQAGGIAVLREKSILLTGYFEYLINTINKTQGREIYRIITPTDIESRGCQLSVICNYKAKATFNYLVSKGIIGDWREPDVIRLSPVPLYNTFSEVYNVYIALNEVIKNIDI
ncbi:kynureninase [Mucilaginibacter sp. UR6-1]|uniref:kynureninase n=1 Tax=Mucilaginibacter sp. UR6-1 TaxID=1435643 RepID=UPI001E5F28CF|nr:kynureninase [Mucilaginibacter sp. UR6-1]MCC8408055.1 kynureninase [Mucilaginibacter sp. UR6-1]